MDKYYQPKIEHFTEHLECGNFRVKRLDREDIESFDFTTEDNGECYNRQDGFTLFGIYPWEKENEYKICIETKTVFLGVINNKSELKRILRQTGIL
jgi:hypothetical protein